MKYLKPPASATALPLVSVIVKDANRTYKKVLNKEAPLAELKAHRKTAQEKLARLESTDTTNYKPKAREANERGKTTLRELMAEIDSVKV